MMRPARASCIEGHHSTRTNVAGLCASYRRLVGQWWALDQWAVVSERWAFCRTSTSSRSGRSQPDSFFFDLLVDQRTIPVFFRHYFFIVKSKALERGMDYGTRVCIFVERISRSFKHVFHLRSAQRVPLYAPSGPEGSPASFGDSKPVDPHTRFVDRRAAGQRIQSTDGFLEDRDAGLNIVTLDGQPFQFLSCQPQSLRVGVIDHGYL